MTISSIPRVADGFLTTEETAKLLKIAPHTLWRYRQDKSEPNVPYLRLGPKTIRYRLADVNAYLEKYTSR